MIHNHQRTLRTRFVFVFIGTFVVVFGLLNIRFVGANIRYWLAPGTIEQPDSLPSLALFPLSADAKDAPLPDHARLVIDSLGINAPIVFGISSDTKDIYKALEQGIVHYSPTTKPGASGVSVILGHSSAYPWYRGEYGSVFALLGRLQPGERFYIQYDDGRAFVFQVKQSIVFNPFASDARLDEIEKSTSPTVVLVSCWPVGTNYRRIAIQAELVSQ